MKKETTLLLIYALSVWSFGAYAQTIKVDAEIRSRAEYRQGFREPLADTLRSSTVNNLRTKLNFAYSAENIRAKISLLDTRTYGSTSTSNTGNSLGVLEAWGEYRFNPQFAFTLGRQSLEYDNKRIFSANNWSNTPGAHDLLLSKYTSGKLEAHLGTAWNNAGDSTQYLSAYTKTYKSLVFLWLTHPIGKVTASAIAVNESFEKGNEPTIRTVYRNTIGTNIGLKNSLIPLSFLFSAYYQFGHDNSQKDLNAYLLALKLEQQLSQIWTVHAGGDWFSGSNTKTTSSKSHTFNKLYGTNHAFNGSIEYWGNIPSQGLTDLYGGISARFSPKFDIDFTFHKFSTSKSISENVGKNIGSEIDITANYNLSKEFSLQGGWSGYFVTKGTRIIKKKTDIDTKFPQWAYIMIAFKPTFFAK